MRVIVTPAVGTKPIPTVFFAQNACRMRMRPRASAVVDSLALLVFVAPVELLESTVVRNGFQAQ